MIDECLMTEDCPGYDRDRGMCLVRPGDCEFRPADGEAALTFETPEPALRRGFLPREAEPDARHAAG